MKPYYITDFSGYSDYFRQYSIAQVELMRILKEVIEVEGMEAPPTKQLYNMVINSLYEVDSLYEAAKGIVKNKSDFVSYLSSQEIMDSVMKTIKTEIQSLKTNDNSN
jgi:GTPase involved in cell partitioning and DNA repair